MAPPLGGKAACEALGMALPQGLDSTPLLLGIDVGSSRTKAMLVDAAAGDEVGTGAGTARS